MKLTSFEPVAKPEAKVLILGSMPGGESLRKQQYYGHPRNLFWDFMEELLGIPAADPYAVRLRKMTEAKVALWDVVKACRREGSLDSNIERETVETHDFASFHEEHRCLCAVFFNGTHATRLYERLVLPHLDQRAQNLYRQRLPSTSPANAGMTRKEKLRQWQAVVDWLK